MITWIESRTITRMNRVKEKCFNGEIEPEDALQQIWDIGMDAYENHSDQVEPDGEVTYTAASISEQIKEKFNI